MTKGNLWNSILASSSREIRVHCGREAWQQGAKSWEVTYSAINKAKRGTNGRARLGAWQPTLVLSTKPPPPKCFITSPKTITNRDQVFKCMCLGEMFLIQTITAGEVVLSHRLPNRIESLPIIHIWTNNCYKEPCQGYSPSRWPLWVWASISGNWGRNWCWRPGVCPRHMAFPF